MARIFFFKEIVGTWGGGKERKGTPFLSAIKDKTLDLGFGLCVCTTSKGAEKYRQLEEKPPHYIQHIIFMMSCQLPNFPLKCTIT